MIKINRVIKKTVALSLTGIMALGSTACTESDDTQEPVEEIVVEETTDTTDDEADAEAELEEDGFEQMDEELANALLGTIESENAITEQVDEDTVTELEESGEIDKDNVILTNVPDSYELYSYGDIPFDISPEDFLELIDEGDIVLMQISDLAIFEAPVRTNLDGAVTGEYVLIADTNKDHVYLTRNEGAAALECGLVDYVYDNPDMVYGPCEGIEFPISTTISVVTHGGDSARYGIDTLNISLKRTAYPKLTDEEFANFREITTSGIKPGTLFRSSSPISPHSNRCGYADYYMEENGIITVVDLADTEEMAKAYSGYEGSYYSQQNVDYLHITAGVGTPDFNTGMADAFRFIAENKGPYLIHCMEGRDRTGFAAAILEGFMGAALDEIMADYLKTYENYYWVVNDVQQPMTDAQLEIISDYMIGNLKTVLHVDDLDNCDLQAEIEDYMHDIGLTNREIKKLKARLGD